MVALFCMPSISATRLIVSAVGAGEAYSASAGHGAIKSLLGRVELLFGRAIRAGRTVTSERRLPLRDQVGLQRVFHLALAGVERGEAFIQPLLLFARLLLDGVELLGLRPRNRPGATAPPQRDPRGLRRGRTWLSW